MSADVRCAAAAASGLACRTPPRHGRPWCINHDPEYAEQRRTNAARGAAASRPGVATVLVPEEPGAALRWLARGLAEGTLSPATASVLLRVVKALMSLPDTAGDERVLREIALRGRLMHGMPPADADEWALAEAVFGGEALEEFRRWEALDGASGAE